MNSPAVRFWTANDRCWTFLKDHHADLRVSFYLFSITYASGQIGKVFAAGVLALAIGAIGSHRSEEDILDCGDSPKTYVMRCARYAITRDLRGSQLLRLRWGSAQAQRCSVC